MFAAALDGVDRDFSLRGIGILSEREITKAAGVLSDSDRQQLAIILKKLGLVVVGLDESSNPAGKADPQPPELFSISEVARMRARTCWTIRSWIRDGIGGVRLGSSWCGGQRRITSAQLLEFDRMVALAKGAVAAPVDDAGAEAELLGIRRASPSLFKSSTLKGGG